MKSIIKVEKVANGYIVEGKENCVKKVAANEEAAAKIVANDLVQIFEIVNHFRDLTKMILE